MNDQIKMLHAHKCIHIINVENKTSISFLISNKFTLIKGTTDSNSL